MKPSALQGKARFRGTPIYMDGGVYILPPLSVGQWEEHEKEQKALEGAAQDGQAPVLELILKAFSRNYPDVTIEWLRAALDLATLAEAAKALHAQSGLTEVPPGE